MLIAVVVSLAALPAAAQDCQEGQKEVIAVESWDIKKVDDPMFSGMDITLKLKSNATKPFRMADASFTFQDGLGRRISSFTIDPDLKAKPGDVVETVNGYQGSEMDRVPKMNRADVVVFACTKALVYEDGTKEEFK
ncbi:hypothetical protein [Rhizobium tibeticum]|uniref:hypothetical protein n=1 Tax=Rhizobium tibeticum TaxID=501024 RepID=UPI0027D7969D|nr:hypothetical protein [Rhizobium tibeticum]